MFDIVQIAVEKGIVLKRWKKVHQILLLKDRSEAKIDRFRNITLVEADLMFVMKFVWAKALTKNVSDSGQLSEAQYARRGQIAQMSVLNKRLSYYLQLILREEAFQADNDAMNCYDRIIDNIAVIASLRMGLSSKGGEFLKRQLTAFQHKILLNGKPSKEYFCNSLRRRIHGTGRGQVGPR